ncbi:hypothetical protein HMI55_004663, partial [Coelomomyces lativittatus]
MHKIPDIVIDNVLRENSDSCHSSATSQFISQHPPIFSTASTPLIGSNCMDSTLKINSSAPS